MRKPLLGSIALATLLFSEASAATIYERFEAMEAEMQGLQTEVTGLREKQAAAEEAAAAKKAEDEEAARLAEEEEEDSDEEDSEDEDENDSDEDDDSDDEDDEDEEEDINDIIEEMQEEITDLTKATSGNHLKFSVDFRTSYDAIEYKMAGDKLLSYLPVTAKYSAPVGAPKTVRDTHRNNDLFSNRLWLNMNWAATKNISFTGQLAYNKLYGGRFGDKGSASRFEDFDWFTNENPSAGGEVRVKSAYFFYRNQTFLGTDIPWTFSVGRRPSTNGHLINLRDDDPAASPSGHSINVEFDGISSKFSFENLTGIEGMYLKLCFGQGITNANEKLNGGNVGFANNYDASIKDTHLAGLIFVPYDDGQYQIGTQFYGASNLPGLESNRRGAYTTADGYDSNFGSITNDLTVQGDLYSGTAWLAVNGIGDEWADFLDDTTFFISGAMSRTNPDDGLDNFGQKKSMLGSSDMENGYSYWTGLQMPSLFSEDGHFGLEFNHGSQYWRSFTYGEDTLIGSKMAVRGDAYEAYFTEPLIEDVLSLQIRYTYLDYNYAGSNGFFGSVTGSAGSIDDIAAAGFRSGSVVDTAQDIRVYLRYRY